jgi:hypothetical protein
VDPGIPEVTWLANVTWDDLDTWDVCHMSVSFLAYGVLNCQLERDTCHPPDWALCLLLVFFHVATDSVV